MFPNVFKFFDTLPIKEIAEEYEAETAEDILREIRIYVDENDIELPEGSDRYFLYGISDEELAYYLKNRYNNCRVDVVYYITF